MKEPERCIIYRDFFRSDLRNIREDVDIPQGKRKGPRGGVVSPFPVKLYTMLEETKKEGLDHLVSWQVHGRSFTIRDANRFVTDVLSR